MGQLNNVVALVTRVIEKSGQLVDVGALAREYGFTDVDGTPPPPFRIPTQSRITQEVSDD
jgi:hypothetical protein